MWPVRSCQRGAHVAAKFGPEPGFKPPIQETRRLNQLGDRRRVFQDRSWAALGIEQLQCRVDAQALVDGRVDILRLERARVRAIALGVGRADDLAAANAAT